MNIGIDLDAVLFYNPITEDVSKKHGLGLPTDYNLQCYPEHVRQECFDLFDSIEAMHGLTPIEGNLEKLKKWESFGFNMFCITGRPQIHTEDTKLMVQEHYPMISATFVCNGYDKREVMRDLNLDMYIDDHYDCVLQAAELGVEQLVLISNDKTLYNHNGVPVIERLAGGHVRESIADILITPHGVINLYPGIWA